MTNISKDGRPLSRRRAPAGILSSVVAIIAGVGVAQAQEREPVISRYCADSILETAPVNPVAKGAPNVIWIMLDDVGYGASSAFGVGFNFVTLYSIAPLDLSKSPIVLSVPDMGKRFWVMQVVNAWNNVSQAPGSRAVGSKGGNFAIGGANWRVPLTPGLTELRMSNGFAVGGSRDN